MRDTIKNLTCRFLADESGLSAVEYGLLAAGIAVGLWTLISGMGTSLRAIYTTVQGNLSEATP
ncbi:MAG TPA: Flp family type IVb pilin [Micropepsaceae bacterium]|jgi:pilus assembly protein Flp/PilA